MHVYIPFKKMTSLLIGSLSYVYLCKIENDIQTEKENKLKST